jgi:hypothetical protein
VPDQNPDFLEEELELDSEIKPAQLVDPRLQSILANKAPEKFLEFIESYDKRQFEFYTIQEQNRHNEELDKQKKGQTQIQFALIAVLLLVCFCLAYAVQTGDSSLPKELITVILAVIGGSGFTYGLTKSRQQE